MKYELKCSSLAVLAAFQGLDSNAAQTWSISIITESPAGQLCSEGFKTTSGVTSSYILGHSGWGHVSCSINMEIPSLPVSTWKTPHLLMCLKWLESITDSVDMNFSKLQEIVKVRGTWHAAVHGATKSRT